MPYRIHLSTRWRKRLFLIHPFGVLALVALGMVNLFQYHHGMPTYYDFIFLGSALTGLYLEGLILAEMYNFGDFRRKVEKPASHTEELARLRVPYRVAGGLFAIFTLASGILPLATMSPDLEVALEEIGLFLPFVAMGIGGILMGLLLGVVCIIGKDPFWFFRKSNCPLR